MKKKQPKKPAAKKKQSPSNVATSAHKPTVWFDGKDIPGPLKGAKLGETVTITAQVRVVNRSESLRGGDSLTAELQKIEQTKKK